MLRQLITATLILSTTACLADDWWDGEEGYQSTGGFKTDLNEGRAVGTEGATPAQNLNNFMGAVNHPPGTPQINPATGVLETPAEKIIREAQIPGSLAPDPRKEVVANGGDPTSPGRLGLDEKLVDARKLAATGLTAEKVQMTTTALGTISLMGMMLTDPKGATEEMDKLDKQLDAYGKNATVFEESIGGYEAGARQLTRDYQNLGNNAPAFAPGSPGVPGSSGLVAGSPGSSSSTSGNNKAAQDILNGMSQEQLDLFRERGVSANDFAEKFANGDFKNSQDIKAFFGASGDPADAATKSFAEARAEGAERGIASTGNVDEGPVVNVKNGSVVSTGAHKEAGSDGLVNQLAAFFKGDGTGKSKVSVTNEDGGEVSEKEKRALLDFALQWWKKGDVTEAKVADGGPRAWDGQKVGKNGKRLPTIFDIASQTYGNFRKENTPVKKQEPVAFNVPRR